MSRTIDHPHRPTAVEGIVVCIHGRWVGNRGQVREVAPPDRSGPVLVGRSLSTRLLRGRDRVPQSQVSRVSEPPDLHPVEPVNDPYSGTHVVNGRSGKGVDI